MHGDWAPCLVLEYVGRKTVQYFIIIIIVVLPEQ